MLLSLFFLHLIKYSQINANMSHYVYIFFSFPLKKKKELNLTPGKAPSFTGIGTSFLEGPGT